MKEKEICVNELKLLVKHAKKRNTAQGVLVYESFLKETQILSNKEQLKEFLNKLKKALAGIEAHGHFTEEEFECVNKIRSINYE